MSETKLILLGTGTPNYAPGYAQQSTAVVVNDQAYLIDAGDGVMTRIMEMRDRGQSAFQPAKLTQLFLTHLHPDHTAGLPGLMIGPWVLERSAPLHIFGPKGTQQLVTSILHAYEIGIAEHRDGLAPINATLTVQVHELHEGVIFDDGQVKVTAFPVSHGGLEAYGLRFDTPDKVIVHSGDTAPVPSLVEQARGCDILVHEVYFGGSLHTRPPAWQTYHRTVHTSGKELAAIANAVQPKLLILTHQLIWGDYTEADLLAEIQADYDGDVHFGRDLDVFRLD